MNKLTTPQTVKLSLYIYTYVDTTICLEENDIHWNISWPYAARGVVVKQKCPGGAESLGMPHNLNYLYLCMK